jgi:hypothetical protein
LGNINPTLYSLAATPANGAFHQITSGENDVYCQSGMPLGEPSDVICPASGVFGFDAANAATPTGYNLVTGLGSVDANALAVAWNASRTTSSSITITPSATNVTVGTSVSFAVAVTPAAGVGAVSFSTVNNGFTTVLGAVALNTPYPPSSSGTATFATTSLPGGSNTVTATYQGDASHNASSSSPAAVTVTGQDFTLQTTTPLTPTSVSAGQSATATLTISPVNGSTQTINFTSSVSTPNSNPGSCTFGLPTGALCSFSNPNNPSNPGSVILDGIHSQTVTLTITTSANMPLATQAITVTGTPSGSGGIPHTATVNLTVTPTTETFTLATTSGASTFPVAVGGNIQVGITVSSTSTPSFITGTGTSATTALPVTYTCTGTPSLATAEISCQISPGSGQPTNLTAITVNLVTTPVTAQLKSPPLGAGSPIFYALLLPGLFGIVLVAGSRPRGLRLLSLIVVLGFSTLWLGSCGGSSGGGNTTPQNGGTPTGQYAVTINATTGAPGGGTPITSSLGFTLSVAAQ